MQFRLHSRQIRRHQSQLPEELRVEPDGRFYQLNRSCRNQGAVLCLPLSHWFLT